MNDCGAARAAPMITDKSTPGAIPGRNASGLGSTKIAGDAEVKGWTDSAFAPKNHPSAPNSLSLLPVTAPAVTPPAPGPPPEAIATRLTSWSLVARVRSRTEDAIRSHSSSPLGRKSQPPPAQAGEALGCRYQSPLCREAFLGASASGPFRLFSNETMH